MRTTHDVSALHRTTIKLILILSVLAVTSCAPTATSSIDPIRINDEVAQFLDSWSAAIAAGDEDGIRDAYVDHDRFMWLEDGELRYATVDAIVAARRSFPPETEIQTHVSDLTTRPITADLVSITAAFNTVLRFPNADVEFGGVFTAIIQRSHSRWQFLEGHTSSLRTESPR